MKRFNNVLVATDTRLDSHPIGDEAGAIARNNDASLTIVDVVPEMPWLVRLMLKDHEDIRKVVGKDNRLIATAKPIRHILFPTDFSPTVDAAFAVCQTPCGRDRRTVAGSARPA